MALDVQTYDYAAPTFFSEGVLVSNKNKKDRAEFKEI